MIGLAQILKKHQPQLQFFQEILFAESSVTLDGVRLVSSNKAVLAGAIILGRFSAIELSIPETTKSSYWVHTVVAKLPGEIKY